MSTEIDVLNRLAPLFPQEVPVIKEYYPKESIAVMSDVSEDAILGFTSLMQGQAEVSQGYALGDFLARLKQATSEWEPFTTVENAHDQIAIRGLETEIANPEWGKKLRDYYLSKQNFLWVDGHPKNVFLSDSFPLVRAIDWDCSHFADPDYMLPNYFGQIPVFMTFGHIKHQDGLQFIEAMMKAYNNRESINQFTEEKMCFYAANQTIQRQDGKWLFDACGGVDEASLKRKAQLFYIGRKLLTQARTFDQYLEILDKEAQEFT